MIKMKMKPNFPNPCFIAPPRLLFDLPVAKICLVQMDREKEKLEGCMKISNCEGSCGYWPTIGSKLNGEMHSLLELFQKLERGYQ